MFRHNINIHHRRSNMMATLSEPSSDSTASIDVDSDDLTEAWREALSRMPNDLYGALKQAMRDTFEREET